MIVEGEAFFLLQMQIHFFYLLDYEVHVESIRVQGAFENTI